MKIMCWEVSFLSPCGKKTKADPMKGSVSLLLAGDYAVLSGCATRFRLRVKASQNRISILGIAYNKIRVLSPFEDRTGRNLESYFFCSTVTFSSSVILRVMYRKPA
jgi:hypothetical protein